MLTFIEYTVEMATKVAAEIHRALIFDILLLILCFNDDIDIVSEVTLSWT